MWLIWLSKREKVFKSNVICIIISKKHFLTINLTIFFAEMFLSDPVWKLLFHTPTKRQTRYPRFVIPSSTIRVTKHPFFLIFSKIFSLLPNALLCSALSSRIFCSSSPRSVLMKPWISLPRRFFMYWSLKFERFGVWKCWFDVIWFGF